MRIVTRGPAWALVLMTASLLVAGQAMAAAGDDKLRVTGAWVNPTSDTDLDGLTVEAQSAIGPSVAWEHMFNDDWGSEIGFMWVEHDVEASGFGEFATISQMPLLFSANWHGLGRSGSRMDIYVGPTIGYVFYGDVELNDSVGGGEASTDDDFVYGLNSGIDIPLGDIVDLNFGFRYLFGSVDVDDGAGGTDEVDIDPVILHAGVAFRF